MEEAAILAALIYRVKHAEAKQDIATVLKHLLPSDLLKQQSSHEWKKEIVKAYNQDSGMSPDEAKVAFLKVIYRWPTYGSAFFEVNQASDQNFPEKLQRWSSVLGQVPSLGLGQGCSRVLLQARVG